MSNQLFLFKKISVIILINLTLSPIYKNEVDKNIEEYYRQEIVI